MPEIPLASVRTLAVSSPSRAACLPAGRTCWAPLRSGATCIRCTRSAAASHRRPPLSALQGRVHVDLSGCSRYHRCQAHGIAPCCTIPTWDRGWPPVGLSGRGWLYAGRDAPKAAAARCEGVGAVDGGRRVRKGWACRRGVGQRKRQRLVAQHLREQLGLLSNVSMQSHAP